MRQFRSILAAVLVIAGAAAAPGADAAAKATGKTDASDIARQLEREIAKLGQLTKVLARTEEQASRAPEPESGQEAVASTAPRARTAPAALPAGTDPALVPISRFKGEEAISGTEEEFANCLYTLGRYAAALKGYKVILESTATPDAKGWAGLQIGHCQRRLGKAGAAQAAYMEVISARPDGRWAEEAGWWMAQVKWQLLWARPIAAAGPLPPPAQQPPTKSPAGAETGRGPAPAAADIPRSPITEKPDRAE